MRQACLSLCLAALIAGDAGAAAKRLVVIKVDGLPGGLVEQQIDQMPWTRRVFVDGGAWLRNFYVRGISLSAPSWAMLDTGRHMAIRGNAEFDRYIPRVYDYLNFFPFYVGYARARRADMPGVEVLDEAGIPLLIDEFPVDQRYQGMQLFQRGVRWETLGNSLRSRMAKPLRTLLDEWQTGFDLGEGIEREQERELTAALRDPNIRYLDYYTGSFDHTAHLTNDPALLLAELKRIDATVGRISTAIEASPLASETVLALVSDHGMNSAPDTYSQGYNLIDFFGSAAGGGHNVVSTRHPLSEFKLRGLDPFVSWVVTPGSGSSYLKDEKDNATAMLDLDGNERASVQLRNSDLNEIRILLGELDGKNRPAVQRAILGVIDRNRAAWSRVLADLGEELAALRRAIERQQALVANDGKKSGDRAGAGNDALRRAVALETWRADQHGYSIYAGAMQRLLDLKEADLKRRVQPEALLPKSVLGEPNSIAQLRNYTVGLAPGGLVVNEDGALDTGRSLARVNYFEALANIRVRNVVQKGLGTKPIDFTAARAPQPESPDAILLYGDDRHQAKLLSCSRNGELWMRYVPTEWGEGFPLRLYEDPDLQVPGDRKAWLSGWHSEREWFEAIHRTRYSNGIIGLAEFFRRWEPDSVPPVFRAADERDWPLLSRFAMRRRQVVEPDLLILAADHWNFNVRGFNPGGNHGSFLRISTHSVFMAAGAGVAAGKQIDRPYDSLSFVPTLRLLMGLPPESDTGPPITDLMTKPQMSSNGAVNPELGR